jgi:hypothetical protein
MRLTCFVSSRNVVVGGTVFSHRDIPKWTWTSPDGKVLNKTGSIITDARHLSDLMVLWGCRGANINSNHYLIISKIRYQISNAKKLYESQAKKFNCGELNKQGVATGYNESLSEHLTGLLAVKVPVEHGRTSAILQQVPLIHLCWKAKVEYLVWWRVWARAKFKKLGI